LISDEAQSLGTDMLEEMRLLSNLNDGKTLKLQIILSGQPDLHKLLQRIDMTQFAQRVVVDCQLEPLSETETGQFIRHRLQVAGGHPSVFTNKACAVVREFEYVDRLFRSAFLSHRHSLCIEKGFGGDRTRACRFWRRTFCLP